MIAHYITIWLKMSVQKFIPYLEMQNAIELHDYKITWRTKPQRSQQKLYLKALRNKYFEGHIKWTTEVGKNLNSSKSSTTNTRT